MPQPSSLQERSDDIDVDRRGLIAWCSYDWANSAYPTVLITFVFAAYYTRALSPDPATGTGEWGQALAISGLAIAILAPIFGAFADQGGRRKPWLGAFTLISVLSALALWTIAPERDFAFRALVLIVVGNTAFELGQVFYNAMLPDLVGRERLGRVSGWAWGLGYAGGLACLVVALVLLVRGGPALFGLDEAAAEPVRATGPFVALWFALFALPLFLLTPDRAARTPPVGGRIRAAFAELVATLRALPRGSAVGRFLLARMIYTDGLNTLFAFGGVYAAGTFDMTFDEILLFGILLNVTAGLGAFAFGWIDDWIGPWRTIAIALVGLIVAGTAVLLVEGKVVFIALGCVIGVFIGPAQSASRSLMARLAPPAERTRLFGLYALSGKATAFVGPALVGWVTVATGSQRLGMATIVGFFLVGLALLPWARRGRT